MVWLKASTAPLMVFKSMLGILPGLLLFLKPELLFPMMVYLQILGP
jgi:hypothetical protein